jgi:hypothetical protein
MRRLLVVASAAALTAAAFGGVAEASHSPGNGPSNQDFVTGAIRLADGGKFHFDAHSAPNGDDPRGHYYARDAFGFLGPFAVSFRSEVECMRTFQQGNATVSIIGTRVTRRESLTAPPEDSAVLFRVEDHGEPGASRDRFNGRPTDNPQDCKLQDVEPTFAAESGNWVVHDAP